MYNINEITTTSKVSLSELEKFANARPILKEKILYCCHLYNINEITTTSKVSLSELGKFANARPILKEKILYYDKKIF